MTAWSPSRAGQCGPSGRLARYRGRPLVCVPRSSLGQLPLPLPFSDDVLREASLRAFDHVWPAMEEKLDAKIKHERKVNMAYAAPATLSYVALIAFLGLRK